jgi:hypothetical protein
VTCDCSAVRGVLTYGRRDLTATRRGRRDWRVKKRRPLPATASNGTSCCAPLLQKGVARRSTGRLLVAVSGALAI